MDSLRFCPLRQPMSAREVLDVATIHSFQTNEAGTYAEFPRVSGFTILELLHEGSHSSVYRARQDRLGRPVALKILSEWPPPTDVALERFNRAAFVSAQVPHPNLLTLYETGTKDGFHYVSLEYVCGQSLQKYIAEVGPAGEPFAMQVAEQVLKALAELHDKEICHRNIKPKNIFVESNGNIRILGHGLASCKRAFFSPHLDARVIGTPHFMAPEMVRGSYCEPRSDLYALGITLFVATAGQPPFEKGPPAAVMARHLTDEPISLGDLRPDLSPEFVNFVHRLMARELEQRFPSARAALEAWEALPKIKAAAGYPVLNLKPGGAQPAGAANTGGAKPIPASKSFSARSKKPANPILIAGGAASLTALLLAAGFFAASWAKNSGANKPPPPIETLRPQFADTPKLPAEQGPESVLFGKLEEKDDAFLNTPTAGVEAWGDYLDKYHDAPVSRRAAAKAKLELYYMLVEKARHSERQHDQNKQLDF